jgi:signal transduction histidine kinase
VGFLDEDEKVLTWSACIIAHSKFRGTRAGFRIEEFGTWAEAIRSRKPVIVNNASTDEWDKNGLPFSHIPLLRFMSIPVFDGERISAVAVVANKSENYDQSDLRQLTLLMDGMWKLVERERSIKALKDAENLAAIGRALSCLAHDMKTPMIAIGGFSKQVQRNISRSHPDWNKMEIVLSEIERLEKMVKDMLDFSKPLHIQKSLEDFSTILEESITVIKPLAEKKSIEFSVESSVPPPPLLLDRFRIIQVFINLLTNAIEASSEAQTVKIRYCKRGDDLVVDVADRGSGIASEIKKDIFLPFFTTRKEGTGLGLPIVKKIIEAHKGSLEVLDNPAKGAIFRIRLPV